MLTPAQKLALLQQIIENLHVEPVRDGSLNQNDLAALQLFTGKIGPSGIAGIRAKAAGAVSQLTEAIYSGLPYRRGVTYAAVANKLTDIIILNYTARIGSPITAGDMSIVEKDID